MAADWTTHMADARGRRKPWRGAIEAAIARTHQRVTERVSVEQVDIVVQDSPRVIRERGHVGFAPNGWMIHLSFDPEAPAFEGNLGIGRCFCARPLWFTAGTVGAGPGQPD